MAFSALVAREVLLMPAGNDPENLKAGKNQPSHIVEHRFQSIFKVPTPVMQEGGAIAESMAKKAQSLPCVLTVSRNKTNSSRMLCFTSCQGGKTITFPDRGRATVMSALYSLYCFGSNSSSASAWDILRDCPCYAGMH